MSPFRRVDEGRSSVLLRRARCLAASAVSGDSLQAFLPPSLLLGFIPSSLLLGVRPAFGVVIAQEPSGHGGEPMREPRAESVNVIRRAGRRGRRRWSRYDAA